MDHALLLKLPLAGKKQNYLYNKFFMLFEINDDGVSVCHNGGNYFNFYRKTSLCIINILPRNNAF